MSYGLMCDCPLPPMPNLSPHDYGHRVRRPLVAGGPPQPGCPQYAEDQERGGRCRFCADAERIGHAAKRYGMTYEGDDIEYPGLATGGGQEGAK
jgi:hypothetical protein